MENTRYRIIDDVETYIRRIAGERGMCIYGSYNPEKCGLQDADFVDALHAKRVSLTKIFNPDN
jgi:hypothetical protein